MRARKASVSAVEVTSPRAIRLPASAMLSVVRSAVLRLLIGAEHVRRFGGPGPTGGNTLHQGDQPGIALVQVLDVLRRKRQACQRGTRTKFLKRWRLLFCPPILPYLNMQSTCRLRSLSAVQRLWSGHHSNSSPPLGEGLGEGGQRRAHP